MADAPGGFGGSGVGPPSPALNFGPDPTPGVYTSGTGGGDWSSGGGGIQGLLDKFSSNPGLLLQAAPLVMSLLGGQGPYPAEKTLQTQATNLGSEGAALSGYINSGTLPPGAKQAVDASTNAQKATATCTAPMPCR